ncbi:MAG: DEAD/DEAH box helicase family protein [Muribaculaceae bacterium]|nr:DEAD/DEAH box helicase family protein [Muribaculaceae bacterium]
MRNFDFLKDIPALSQIHEYCELAESRVNTEPVTSAIYARKALEALVRIIYRLKNVEIKERASMSDLVHDPMFVEFISNADLMRAITWVRRVGNLAAHNGEITKRDAFFSALNLYKVVGGILQKLRVIETLAPFNGDLIPVGDSKSGRNNVRIAGEVKSEIIEVAEPEVKLDVAPRQIEEAPQVQPELSWGNISEAETRRRFIDLMLREAGWKVLEEEGLVSGGNACIEIEVDGMPNSSGKGYADYVLFGDNGKPLAVIEAKRTSVDPVAGNQQAKLYADALEKKYGVRPVIYYTNGYKIHFIDGLGYPPRELASFHSKADLEVIHNQRHSSLQINDYSINPKISDRYYQIRAIKSIGEWFNAKHRRGLLVMATGTGKTRTAISLVDVLQRNGRIKNTLFLADRSSLVKQAFDDFNKHLPHSSTSRLDVQDPDLNARILFSTYHTMMGYINGDNKPLSVGRFDLIIIDEAHRSVFGKFGDIFRYFDSLLVGLTATPRDQVDKSTYELLQLEGGEPTDSYELDAAIQDGYLVPYRALQRASEIIEKGIKYDDLSDDEKRQLEAVWEYEQATKDPDQEFEPRNITEKEIYNYIYNNDTIDKMLQDLMENGLKVESGEKIGKTIIFAMNSKTAALIVERFNVLYPEYGSDFCVQIDYSIKYAQSLIDNLKQRDKLPQIAVSVDMLDTGVDVPDVLNLVFFKRVRSRIKFMQMIGRGTRLSPDIFGPGNDKKEFRIFDWGANFKYFGENPKEPNLPRQISLTERLFGFRADIVRALQAPQYQEDEFAKGLHDDIKKILKKEVAGLNDNHISVRANWETVTKFRDPASWQHLSDVDVVDLKNKIAPLLVKSVENEMAKKFDLLALYVQLGLVDPAFASDSYEGQITKIADVLRGKASINEVKEKLPLLNEIMTSEFWTNKSLASIEKMRLKIRDLMKYLVGEPGKDFTVNIEDLIKDGGEAAAFNTTMTYREKLLDFLTNNRNHPVLQKIHNLEKLTGEDIDELEHILWQELGTKEDYERYLRREQMTADIPVAAFIRKVNGVDRKKAIQMFTEFISANTLTAGQEEFINSILNYVCQNGDMDVRVLTSKSIFINSLLKYFPDNTAKVGEFITMLHNIISAA